MLKRLGEKFLRGYVRGPEKALGPRGEDFAVRMVERKGLAVLARNFRIPRGEVDLIARDGESIVFIEVKTRRTTEFGEPFESVGPLKQRKIICAAQAFLKQFDPVPPCRFDVISILEKGEQFEGNWITDAFEAE